MKYNRHGRPDRTTKVRNIPGRVSIHLPVEADGRRFGDREMDTIVGKDGKGTEPLAKVVIRLLFPYKNTICSITTDNGSGFCGHHLVSKALTPRGTKDSNLVFFADSYSSWQKGMVENANKLIRQYIPKGSDFYSLADAFIRKVQHKINRRPRKKLNFDSPKNAFFRQIANFALAS